jgi:hypothetical protein
VGGVILSGIVYRDWDLSEACCSHAADHTLSGANISGTLFIDGYFGLERMEYAIP